MSPSADIAGLSIDDIIRRYPRERLFVQPSEWTPRHLELLHCFFDGDEDENYGYGSGSSDNDDDSYDNYAVHAPGSDDDFRHRRAPRQRLPSSPRPVAVAPAASMVDPRPFDYWTHVAEGLLTLETKSAVVRRLLAMLDGPLQFVRPSGFFQYGADHEFRLHGAVFAPAANLSAAKSKAPVFALVQRGLIDMQRQNVYPPPRPRRREHRDNKPVAQLQQLQLKQLEPADPWRDPYVAAVLIGLAQAQAEELEFTPAEAKLHMFKTATLLVDEKNPEYMMFFTAKISLAFLCKFCYAEDIPLPPQSVNLASLPIRCKTIPYRPLETLRQRLIDEILPVARD